MAEQLREQAERHEKLELDDLVKENLKNVEQAAELSESEPKHSIEDLKDTVHEQAISGKEFSTTERESTSASHTFGAHRELKLQSYKQTLGRIRTRLNGPEKSFSKVIHDKRIEKVSNVGAQTVARPLGLMTAGLTTFIGSLVVLWMARHYGFTYNFSLFVILFAGGYLGGTLLEGLIKVFKRRR